VLPNRRFQYPDPDHFLPKLLKSLVGGDGLEPPTFCV
jgi:hypothetical protein